MKIDDIKISDTHGLSYKETADIYKAYWNSIKHFLELNDLKDDYTEEEFDKLRCSVSVPSIGKFGVTYKKYLSIKKQYKITHNEHKKDSKN